MKQITRETLKSKGALKGSVISIAHTDIEECCGLYELTDYHLESNTYTARPLDDNGNFLPEKLTLTAEDLLYAYVS